MILFFDFVYKSTFVHGNFGAVVVIANIRHRII